MRTWSQSINLLQEQERKFTQVVGNVVGGQGETGKVKEDVKNEKNP